jgi:hypothetical protein
MEVFNATFCHYAPINVNPEGGWGSGKGGGDLINQLVPWVGIWTDTFSKWPEGGDF